MFVFFFSFKKGCPKIENAYKIDLKIINHMFINEKINHFNS